MSRLEKLADWCDKAMAFSFYALIYFLPISIALTEIFSTAALLCWFLKRGTFFYIDLRRDSLRGRHRFFVHNVSLFLESFKPVSSYLTIPVTVFLFFSFISTLLSKHHVVSLEGFFGKTLQNVFIYFTLIECINSSKRLKIFLRTFFFSATLVSISGIYQYFIGQEFILGNMFEGRISSSLRQANDFGAYLVIVMPILLGAAFSRIGCNWKSGLPGRLFISKRDAVFSVVLFVVTFTCLGLTYSRGAWVGFLFAMAYFCLQKRKFIYVNCLVVLLFFGIFYPQLPGYRHINFIADRAVITLQESLSGLGSTSPAELDTNSQKSAKKDKGVDTHVGMAPPASAPKPEKNFFVYFWQKGTWLIGRIDGSGRRGYWQEAIRMIKEYPIFGVGVNAYSLVAPKYKINWGGYPHNCYLQMLVEIGVVGFLSFLWIIFMIFRVAGIKGAQIHDPSLKIFLIGVLSGFAGFLVHSFFDTNFYSVQLGNLMWLIMGMIMAIQNVGGRDQEDSMQIREDCKMKILHVSRITIRICLFFVILFSIFFCYLKRMTLNPQYGEVFYNIGINCAGCPAQERLNYFYKALSYDPIHSKAYYAIGSIYEDLGRKEEALKFYVKSASLDYRYVDAYWKVGYFYFCKGDFDAAFRYLFHAYRQNPGRVDVNYYLGILYEIKKEYNEALSHHRRIVCPSAKCVDALARAGALLHLLDMDLHAMSVPADLRRMQRNDLADQLENFIKTNEYPEFMSKKD